MKFEKSDKKKVRPEDGARMVPPGYSKPQKSKKQMVKAGQADVLGGK